MNDQTIPADKVREILKKLVDDGHGCPEQTLGAVADNLRALLPPPQPTTGLLGRWAKHPAYGDVMCAWDKPGSKGDIPVRWMAENEMGGLCGTTVPLDSLTFPHQATRPEDVPAGEAWLVDVEDSEESHKSIVALKDEHDAWRVCGELMTDFFWRDEEVTLIAPLTPERPASDLQAKYDALAEKHSLLDMTHQEAKKRIEKLEKKFLFDLKSVPEDAEALVDFVRGQKEEAIVNHMQNMALAYRNIERVLRNREQPITPRIVSTEAEYAALPIGSIVSKPDAPHIRHAVFKKIKKNKWERTGDKVHMADHHMAQMKLPVLRYGRGDEEVEP